MSNTNNRFSPRRRGMEVDNRGRPARFSALCAALALAALGVLAMPAHAVLDLKRGEPAPAIAVRAVGGQGVHLEDLRGRIVVVLFAEAGRERSQHAAQAIQRGMGQKALSGTPISWLVIYTKGSDPRQIDAEARELRDSPAQTTFIHDRDRQAFGAYYAVALPSAVVIDAEGRIVHAMAGLNHRFEHIFNDALLLAAGRITAEDFDLALKGSPEERDENQRRAERLAQMARRLSERGQYEQAELQYIEALSEAPELITARLGLADLFMRSDRLDEAETAFRGVLRAHPASLEAAGGLALALALKGDIEGAERLALALIERSPSRPRAHYVLGLVHQQRGEHQQAALAFRKAAELLLARAGADDTGNGGQPYP